MLIEKTIKKKSFTDLSEQLKTLWQCDWLKILNNDLLQRILVNNFDSVDLSSHPVEDLLVLGIASLQGFVQHNFVGPLDDCSAQYQQLAFYAAIKNDEIKKYLLTDGEDVNTNARRIELLAFAKLIFLHISTRLECIHDPIDQFICRSWFLRYSVIQQQVIDENTETLYTGIIRAADDLLKAIEIVDIDVETKGLCVLEIVQALLQYKRIWMAKDKLQYLQTLLNVDITVEGKLGVRTKYQQKPVPQLLLKISPSNESISSSADFPTNQSVKLPKLLRLDDDIRLERIEFVDEADNAILKLSNIEQALILSTFQYIQLSQPKDKLADEEVMPYLTTLMYQECGPWAVRVAALVLNINMEATHKRTVERSLSQCEEILKFVTEAGELMCSKGFHMFMPHTQDHDGQYILN